MSTQPTDWKDVNDWQDIGSVMEPGKSEARKAAEVPDYLKGNTGYILNPINPNARKTGTVTARDESGKIYTIELDPKLPAALVPGMIEGHIRSKNQPTFLDRLKRTPGTILPFGAGDGVDIGNLMEGFTGAPANTPQRNLTPSQSFVRGMDTVGSRLRDNAAGMVKTSVIMGGGGIPAVREALNIPSALKHALYGAPKDLIGGAIETAQGGDPTRMQGAAADIVSQTLPAVYGGLKVAQSLPDMVQASRLKAIARARATEINSLSEVIGPGVLDGPPQYAAETSQPFAKQFYQEAGVNPKDVLPSGGPSADLLRGGSQAMLNKLNAALQAEYVRTGGNAADFVPARSIAMATADGLVNIADRPITNAVAAVATRELPEVQGAIVQRMRAAAASSPDSALGAAMDNVATQIERNGNTALGLDNLKSYFNKETQRFYRGTPSAQSAATATSAYAYKYAADLIRENFYPWLEKNTTAAGIAEAGRAESAAIASRDGIFKSWTRAAKLDANAGVQKFMDYVANGPEGIAQGSLKPATTVAGIAARTPGFFLRKMPLGRFNELLRQGIGDISDFRPMDASALATRGTAHPMSSEFGSATPASGRLPYQEPLSNVQPSSPAHPMTALDVSNRNRAVLPHEAANPVPASSPVDRPANITNAEKQGGYPLSVPDSIPRAKKR